MTLIKARGLYEYQPLSLTKPQIRLVALKDALSIGGFVACNLHVFDVDSAPYYITLSYLWGPPEPTQIILVDGKWLRVRQNLFDFLKCFRDDPSNVQYLWIDQLCIAQSRDDERNQQVRLMSQIYRRCLYVIVWLGDQYSAWPAEFPVKPTYGCALAAFNNPYFKRLWVIQEILLAPQVRVLCGECRPLGRPRAWLSLEELLTVVRSGEDGKAFLDTVFLQSIFGDPDLQRNPDDRGLMLLSDCIKRFSKYACSEPRDKVYGLLGLVLEDQRPLVDYNKSLENVVADVLFSMAKVYWLEPRDTRSVVGTDIPARYWFDWDRLTTLAQHMGLAEHDFALSYLIDKTYSVMDAAKSASQNSNPITDIGHEVVDGKGRWWYASNDTQYPLLFFPDFTAWSGRSEAFLQQQANRLHIPNPLIFERPERRS